MSSLREMGSNSAIRRENNILHLMGLLKSGTGVQEIMKILGVRPSTIYSYLLEIQTHQFADGGYISYLESLDIKDVDQKKEWESWVKRAKKYIAKPEDIAFLKGCDEKFYDELHYNLLVFKKIK